MGQAKASRSPDPVGPGGTRVLSLKLMAPAASVSWVAVTAEVLRSRKLKCDCTDVAGMSGYAFVVNVHPTLCPSGPTAFDLSVLVEGTEALGLEVELAAIGRAGTAEDRDAMEQLFERVREEIDAGRACVVWGATSVPEFAIVYGYDQRSYLVRSFRSCRPGRNRPLGPRDSPEEPVPLDRLQAPGCIAGFFFGEPVRAEPHRPIRAALSRAVRLLRGEHACLDPAYAHGAAAFAAWAAALDSGRAQPAGNRYNAACYQELQGWAAAFVGRLAKQNPSAAGELSVASGEFECSAQNLARLGKRLALVGSEHLAPALRREAVELLRDCGRATAHATDALACALALL